MNKIIELYNKINHIWKVQLDEDGNIWMKHLSDSNDWFCVSQTAFIIDDLLPAIRDTKEFQDGFWAWMEWNNYRVVGDDCVQFDLKDMDTCYRKLLLADEKEYIKSILKQA